MCKKREQGRKDMWTTRSRAWERALVTECEAFLSGRSAQYLDSQNRLIPVWAWLNLLAHGSERDIAVLAAGEWESPRRASATSVWRQAFAFLAQELLNQATRQGRPLAEIQRSTLVPIELELAGPRAPTFLKPAGLVTSVLRALTEHPTSHNR
jgi:hypothetical protein